MDEWFFEIKEAPMKTVCYIAAAALLMCFYSIAYSDQKFMANCASLVTTSGFQPEKVLDVTSGGASYTTVPPAPGSSLACYHYDWIRLKVPLIFSSSLKMIASWGGKQADFCEHSNIEYAVYRKHPLFGLTMLGGGQRWGKSIKGNCTYSVSNFPVLSWGTDFAQVGGVNSGATSSFYIAVLSWYHNHSGNSCGSAVSCYAPSVVLVWWG